MTGRHDQLPAVPDQLAPLRQLWCGDGATVRVEPDGALSVRGLDAAAVGAASLALLVPLQELSTHTPTLEEVFLDMTRPSLEHAGGAAS